MEKIDNMFMDVSPKSTQWRLIEYKLQLATGSTTVVVKRIQSLLNPNLLSGFEKKNKGGLIMDSFMLKDGNRLEKIVEKGFNFGKNGEKFTIGFLKIQSIQGKSCEVVMYKIAVGKSYCMPVGNKDKIEKVSGFDSVYLYEQNQEYFKHDYILFENEQVIPCYLIQLQFDQNKQSNLKPPSCDNCNTNNSKNYCITQQINLCTQCDLDLHKNKMSLRHIRVDIKQKPKSYGICKQHNGAKLELFCTDCSEPICLRCKICGDHVNGQYGNHHIVTVSDAYDRIVGLSKQVDPGLQKRKHKIIQLLSCVDIKIKEVNKKASQVQEQISLIFQNALKQLRYITQKKMSYLVADQLDLKRQFDQIQWMQSFLKYQHQHLQPSDFLSNWSQHSKLRKQILSLTNIPILTNIIPDMTIQGKVQILSDSLNIVPSNNERNKTQNQRIEVSTEFRKKIFSQSAGSKQIIDKNDAMVTNFILETGSKQYQKTKLYPFKQGIMQHR